MSHNIGFRESVPLKRSCQYFVLAFLSSSQKRTQKIEGVLQDLPSFTTIGAGFVVFQQKLCDAEIGARISALNTLLACTRIGRLQSQTAWHVTFNLYKVGYYKTTQKHYNLIYH